MSFAALLSFMFHLLIKLIGLIRLEVDCVLYIGVCFLCIHLEFRFKCCL